MRARHVVLVLSGSLVLSACEKASGPGAGTPPPADAGTTAPAGAAAAVPAGGATSAETPPAAAPAAGSTVRLPSGIEYTVLKEGSGEPPRYGATVTAHVKTSLPDGKVVQDTFAHGVPTRLEVDTLKLVPGMVELLRLMKPGGRLRAVIPSRLAYRDEGYPGVVPGRTDLHCEIELVGVAH